MTVPIFPLGRKVGTNIPVISVEIVDTKLTNHYIVSSFSGLRSVLFERSWTIKLL